MRMSIQTIAASISSTRACRVLLCTLLCVAPAAFCPVSQAQTANTGAIAGSVTDPSGAVVAGAQIRVSNDGTGEIRNVSSSRQGAYLVPQLAPGAYTVEVSQPGFKGTTYPNLQVNVTETLGLNIHLVVGDVRENVTVQGAEEDLQVESSALGRVTSGVVINSLPLVARNYTQVIGLNPGVAAEVTNAGELGRGGGSDGSDAFVSQGGSSRDNNFQLNGVEIDDFEASGSFSGGIATPNPDAIQEFKVQTGQYDATYGTRRRGQRRSHHKGGQQRLPRQCL